MVRWWVEVRGSKGFQSIRLKSKLLSSLLLMLLVLSISYVLVNDSLSSLPSRLNLAIQCCWGEKFIPVYLEFARKCGETLEEEGEFGTVNHYLNDKYVADLILPDDLVEDILFKMARMVNNSLPTYTTPETLEAIKTQIVGNMREQIKGCKESYSATVERQTLHEQQQQRLHSAVNANFTVAKKTFTDNILKDTRDMVLKKWKNWILEEFLGNPELRDAANENEETSMIREQAKQTVKKMTQCLEEIKTIL